MEKKISCVSCDTDISVSKNNTMFKCPNCVKKNIVRCGKCRQQSVEYACECGFLGP